MCVESLFFSILDASPLDASPLPASQQQAIHLRICTVGRYSPTKLRNPAFLLASATGYSLNSYPPSKIWPIGERSATGYSLQQPIGIEYFDALWDYNDPLSKI